MSIKDVGKVPTSTQTKQENRKGQPHYVANPRKPVNKSKVVMFNLVADEKPTTLTFKGEDIVYIGTYREKEYNREMVIRYVRGQSSIIKDEQPDYVKSPDYILFKEGVLTVQRTNKALIDFMTLSNGNRDNEDRDAAKDMKWYMFDPDKAKEEQVEQAITQMDAEKTVFDLETNQLFGMCGILGIPAEDVLSAKLGLKSYATNNPKEILALAQDPSLEIKSNYMTGKLMGVIEVDNKNRVAWKGAKNAITYIPTGMDEINYMYDFLRSEEGESAYEELMKRIS